MTRVTRVELAGVTTHTATDIQIPDRGVVLVSGSNGSGKSTILEALPLVLWGRTLRGTKVWSSSSSLVAVTVDGVRYQRTQHGSRSSLTWQGAPTFESTKHALAYLAERFGPFAAWQQSCVLSSSDASSFTLATDADRKRLVERLAGLEAYDQAHDRLKAQARDARQKCAIATSGVQHAVYRVDAARRQLESLDRPAPEPVPPRPPGPAPSPQAQPDADRQLHELSRAIATDQARLPALVHAERAASGEVAVLRARAQALAVDTCASCGQAVHADLRTSADADLAAALAKLDKATNARDSAQRELADAQREQAKLQEAIRQDRVQLDRHTSQVQAYQRELDAYERAAQLSSQLAAQRYRAKTEVRVAKQALREAKAVELAAQSEQAHLDAACLVIGPKGYRAAQLADTLGALEAASNTWLARLGSDLRVGISPTGQKANGDPTAQVSLVVHGAGGGDYRGASGGERRRVDVAIMLGLAQIADAARGGPPSTLWADECFDALDAHGRAALAQLLAELASDRAVVVVSHTALDEIGECARVHYRVDRGKVTSV